KKNVTTPATTSASSTTGSTTLLTIRISATHLRHRRDVLDVGVEPRPVAERVGEDPVERRHQPQALVELVGVLVEHVDDAAQVGQRGGEVAAALPDQPGQLDGQVGRRAQQVVDRLPPSVESLEQHRRVAHQADDVLVACVERVGDASQVLQQGADLLVAGGQVR